MSVVNKMLKDLEQRDKQSVYEADYVPMESRSHRTRKLVVGAFVLILVVGFSIWFLVSQGYVGVEGSSIKAPILSTTDKNNSSKIEAEEAIQAPKAQSDVQDASPTDEQSRVLLSELDQATLQSLDSAKKAEQATKVAEAKLAEVNRELEEARALIAAKSAAAKQQAATKAEEAVSLSPVAATVVDETNSSSNDNSPTEPAVFNVSSSNKSTSENRMLEQRIQLSLKNGDTAAALTDLNNLLSLEPRNSSARKRLASLEFAQGNPKRAAFLLDQGIKLAPADSSMRLMQARLLFREDRAAQALALLNEHPTNVIADNDLLSFRAALAEKQKQYATSLHDYSVLLQRQPGNARWMLGLAISQDKQKMYAEAVITYKKVKSSNQLSTQVVSFVDGRLAALVGS